MSAVLRQLVGRCGPCCDVPFRPSLRRFYTASARRCPSPHPSATPAGLARPSQAHARRTLRYGFPILSRMSENNSFASAQPLGVISLDMEQFGIRPDGTSFVIDGLPEGVVKIASFSQLLPAQSSQLSSLAGHRLDLAFAKTCLDLIMQQTPMGKGLCGEPQSSTTASAFRRRLREGRLIKQQKLTRCHRPIGQEESLSTLIRCCGTMNRLRNTPWLHSSQG